MSIRMNSKQNLAKVINERLSERFSMFKEVKDKTKKNEEKILMNKSQMLLEKKRKRDLIISAEI